MLLNLGVSEALLGPCSDQRGTVETFSNLFEKSKKESNNKTEKDSVFKAAQKIHMYKLVPKQRSYLKYHTFFNITWARVNQN